MRIALTFFLIFILGNSSFFAQEEGFEFVNPPITIVVLGSSTAAGAGTWPIDNAWVNRFRCYVQTYNHENQVINLAKGGYNSYHLLPTGSSTKNRSAVDTLRNITKAMEYKPDGIIINLPSNDVSSGFSVKEQLNNFRTYQAYADSFGVELWITTTQARNFPRKSDRQLQFNIKDSLRGLFPRTCIDFWTGFCDEEFMILKEYDSGDGCHLNNEGHRILTERVIDSQAFCWELNETSFQRSTDIALKEELSPHMMEIGFKGRVEFDSLQSDKSRIVKVIQQGRVLNATEVSETKYDVQTIVDLREPVKVVFQTPNTLTKTVEFDMTEMIGQENKPTNYYPIATLPMREDPLDSFTYQFPNASLTVAKFNYDSTDMSVSLDFQHVVFQKQRILDALISPPSDGNKLITYWENGNKKSVLKFKNGQLNGKSKWFREDGTKERFVKFRNGMYHGKYIEFYDVGKKKSIKTFKNDLQIGETKSFKWPGNVNF